MKIDLNDLSPQSQVQREAISNGLKVLVDQGNDRARFTMACGVGKTFLQLKLAEALISRVTEPRHWRIVVLVPTLALVRQSRDEWMENLERSDLYDSICVCSDPTLTEGVLQGPDADEIMLSAEELAGIGVAPETTAQTDILRINRWLDEREALPAMKLPMVSVIFTTYQSAPVVGMAMAARSAKGRAIDIGVFDEAHKTAGESGKRFAYALDDANITIRKRVFFTATERVLNQEAISEDDYSVISMDKEAIYGPLAHKTTFSEAIERGLIVPYEVLVTVVNDDEIATQLLNKRHIRVSNGKETNARDLAAMAAIQFAMEKFNLSKTITFHRDVKSAQEFAALPQHMQGDRFADSAGFHCLHVNGRQPPAIRLAQMQEYASGSGRRLITNARCLTEGVNVPATDLVAFVDPRKGMVDIVQAIGRVVRKSPGKEKGYVLLPVHLAQRPGESMDEALDRGLRDFRRINAVLCALSENDEVLKDSIRRARVAGWLPQTATHKNNSGEVTGAPVRILMTDGFGNEIHEDELVQSISLRIRNRLTSGWDVGFAHLSKFHEVNGHCNVQISFATPDGYPLGVWVGKQRSEFKRGGYSPERKAQMDAIGMQWDAHEAAWETGLAHVKKYFEVNGNFEVPSAYVWPEDKYPVGVWWGKQRALIKKGKLPSERMAKVVAIGVRTVNGFKLPKAPSKNATRENQAIPKSSRKPQAGSDDARMPVTPQLKPGGRNIAWLHGFSLLKEYVRQYGAPVVQSRYFTPGGYPLGRWLRAQHSAFKQGVLDEDRRLALAEIGVEWARNNSSTISHGDPASERITTPSHADMAINGSSGQPQPPQYPSFPANGGALMDVRAVSLAMGLSEQQTRRFLKSPPPGFPAVVKSGTRIYLKRIPLEMWLQKAAHVANQ